jgi:hypothetical protein
MQLARHSDPRLTAARYGRAQLCDLGTAVEKLASVLPGAARAEAARATGTDGHLRHGVESLRPACAAAEAGCVRLRAVDSGGPAKGDKGAGPNHPELQGVEADCGQLRLVEGNGPRGIRTPNPGIMSPAFCH